MIEIIGALLIIVIAVLADKASERWRKPLWILFGILVLGQAVLLIYTRKTEEHEARNREQVLNGKLDTTQNKLDRAQETLTATQLSQERMRGQLDALQMIAGKMGQNNSNDMRQLVAAIGKVADTGKIGALTNQQLCDRAHDLAKRLREFAHKYYDTDMSAVMAQQAEMRAAKTDDDKNAVWNKYRQADINRYQQADFEFKSNYVSEAVYLRDETSKRLPSVPKPEVTEDLIFRGESGGSFGTYGAADYFDKLALTLCHK